LVDAASAAQRDRIVPETVVVNCPFSAQKVSFGLLSILHRAVRRAVALRSTAAEQRALRVVFRFFPYLKTLLLHTAFESELNAAWRQLDATESQPPAAVSVEFEVVGPLQYSQYMARMREGHMFVESVHYGGCNTVIDALYLGLPMLTRQGDKWYNRIGTAILQAAFPAPSGNGAATPSSAAEQPTIPQLLVSTTDEMYVEKIGKLLSNVSLRAAISRRIDAESQLSTLFDHGAALDERAAAPDATDLKRPEQWRDEADGFAAAFDFLLESHDALQRERSERTARGEAMRVIRVKEELEARLTAADRVSVKQRKKEAAEARKKVRVAPLPPASRVTAKQLKQQEKAKAKQAAADAARRSQGKASKQRAKERKRALKDDL
jgi:hypothetical protein